MFGIAPITQCPWMVRPIGAGTALYISLPSIGSVAVGRVKVGPTPQMCGRCAQCASERGGDEALSAGERAALASRPA